MAINAGNLVKLCLWSSDLLMLDQPTAAAFLVALRLHSLEFGCCQQRMPAVKEQNCTSL